MSYNLILYSTIPACLVEGRYSTLPLWARDLEAQAEVADQVTLICPVTEAETPEGLAAVPAGVTVTPAPRTLNLAEARRLVHGMDIVQVPGTQPLWRAPLARPLLRAGKIEGAVGIVGISSNRAKTALQNAPRAPSQVHRRTKALFEAGAIMFSQKTLLREANAAFVVGDGLRSLWALKGRSPFVETASWIRRADVIEETALNRRMAAARSRHVLRLCVASRLEAMKGVHIAIDALSMLSNGEGARPYSLLILGEGPERERLQSLAVRRGVASSVTFGGERSYPEDFHASVADQDIILLTNLGDEQPRLIFDAASQGVPVLCPNTAPYRNLGLPSELLYVLGDSAALAQGIERLNGYDYREKIARDMRSLGLRFTIESMHAARAKWMQKLVETRLK